MPDISPDGSQIVMSEFSEKGDLLSVLNLDEGLNKALNQEPAFDYDVSLSEIDGNILSDLDEKKYVPVKYKEALRGIQLHSWSPAILNDEVGVNLSFSDILANYASTFTGGFDFDEDRSFYDFQIQYGKFYPLLQFGISNNYDSDDVSFSSRKLRRLSTGITFPFTWQSGNFATDLSVGGSYQLLEELELSDGADVFSGYNTSFSFSSVRRMAYQNVGHRAGVILNLRQGHLFKNTDRKELWARTKLYAPGIGANHSIVWEGVYRKRDNDDVSFVGTGLRFARGYETIANNEIRYSAINYHFPIFYPDTGLPGILYCSRVRGNIFYDYLEASIAGSKKFQKSAGLELYFDLNFVNWVPFQLGYRGAVLLTDDYKDYADNRWVIEPVLLFSL